MSRVGKKPIAIPEKVKITYENKVIIVDGDKGRLEQSIHSDIELEIKDNDINVIMVKENRKTHSLQGLTRSLIANMIKGVSNGFERVLEINGIGYKAQSKGNTLVFNLGYSNPVNFELPEGITAKVERNIVRLFGNNKQKLGLVAASVRRLRPPEPYKGKGIKYIEEHIKRKAGKAGIKQQ
mmetsp:Transcript_475/g.304  ORF Transcript_475/g.304 Transcript_475/m.304 type:complete len:181 (-) Transcript_475:591-1133(-)